MLNFCVSAQEEEEEDSDDSDGSDKTISWSDDEVLQLLEQVYLMCDQTRFCIICGAVSNKLVLIAAAHSVSIHSGFIYMGRSSLRAVAYASGRPVS